MSQLTHMTESCHTYQWVHGLHTKGSCLAYECCMYVDFPAVLSPKLVKSHIWMSHVRNMNVRCLGYQSVVWHIWMMYIRWLARRSVAQMSHVTHMNESSQEYTCDMSWIWKCRVTYMDNVYTLTFLSFCRLNESCHTYESVMWKIQSVVWHIWMMYIRWLARRSVAQMSHVTHMNESCHTYEWVMWRIQSVVSRIWMMYISWPSCRSVTWISQVTHMNESCHIYECNTPQIWKCRVTYMDDVYTLTNLSCRRLNESCHTYEWVMSQIWM